MANVGANCVAFWPLETFEADREMSGGRLAMEGRMMLMAEHCGTHIDVPRHFVEGGTTVDQLPLEKVILPGHLLDFTHKKVREAITIADFEEAERRSGQKIGSGTAVVAWTGVDKDWAKPRVIKARPYVPGPAADGLVVRCVTVLET